MIEKPFLIKMLTVSCLERKYLFYFLLFPEEIDLSTERKLIGNTHTLRRAKRGWEVLWAH